MVFNFGISRAIFESSFHIILPAGRELGFSKILGSIEGAVMVLRTLEATLRTQGVENILGITFL